MIPSVTTLRGPLDIAFTAEWDTLQTARLVRAKGFLATHFISF